MFQKKLLLLVFVLVIGAVGCDFNSGDNDSSGKGDLELNIRLAHTKADSTTVPSLVGQSLEPASFRVSGIGPNGSTFMQDGITLAQTTITVPDLVFGTWTITAEALNDEDIAIGAGTTEVLIQTGRTAECSIVIVPVQGFGTITFDISWNRAIDSPAVVARLTRTDGVLEDIELTGSDFLIDGNQATANLEDVAAGYYTLSISLYDATGEMHTYLGGAVRVIRVGDSVQTSVVFEIIANSEYGYGDVDVNVTIDMKDPIVVVMSGELASIAYEDSMTVTASCPDETETVEYSWYLNGEFMATGSSYTVNEDLPDVLDIPDGTYNLDVVALNEYGDRAGSAAHSFVVYSTAGLPAIPSDFTASNITATSVDLSWTDNSSDEDGFEIQVLLPGDAEFIVLDSNIPPGTVVHLDTGLTPEAVYSYRIRSYNTFGYSEYVQIQVTTLSDSVDELVVHYMFENNLDDSSSKGNDGTMINGSSSFVNGVIGSNSINIDADRIDCGTDPNFALTDYMTVSFWINTNNADRGSIICMGTNLNYWQITYDDIGRIRFKTGVSSVAEVLTSTAAITENVWHHVSIRVNNISNEADFYLDGQYVDTGSYTNSLPDISGEHMYIGADWNNNSQWTGNIDDVRIYNYTLSTEEIQVLYGLSLSTHYQLDESSGTTAADIAGANDGTVTSTAAWNPTGGVVDGYMSFAVNDQTLDCGSDLIGAGDRTISFWFNPQGISNEDEIFINNGEFSVKWNQDDKVIMYRSNDDAATSYIDSRFGDSVDIGTWSLVTIVRDATGPDLIYINGIIGSFIDQYAGTPTAGSNLIIGNNDVIDTIYLPFNLDDLRIYNRTLSASEILEIYNSSLAATYTVDFAGVAGTADGNGVWELDLNEFPVGSGDIDYNTRNPVSSAGLVDLSVSGLPLYTTADPGSYDEMMLWIEMPISLPLKSIAQLVFTFEGYSDQPNDFEVWILRQDSVEAWAPLSSWLQLGSWDFIDDELHDDQINILTCTLDLNIEDYIEPNGTITWIVGTPLGHSDPFYVDYVKVDVITQEVVE